MKDEYTAKDFVKAVKNPHVGKLIKNGKFTVIVEHDTYNEVVEVDTKAGKINLLRKIFSIK